MGVSVAVGGEVNEGVTVGGKVGGTVGVSLATGPTAVGVAELPAGTVAKIGVRVAVAVAVRVVVRVGCGVKVLPGPADGVEEGVGVEDGEGATVREGEAEGRTGAGVALATAVNRPVTEGTGVCKLARISVTNSNSSVGLSRTTTSRIIPVLTGNTRVLCGSAR